MQLWQDGVVAGLAAVGLASILWMAVRGLLFSRPAGRFRAIALVPVRGDCETLEGQIRSLTLIASQQGTISRVLMVDCGLTEEGQKLCRLLAEDERWVVFCQKDQIPHYLP